MDRNEPVAKISAVAHSEIHLSDEAYLDELERKGIVTRAKKKLPSSDWLRAHLVKLPPGVSAVEALLQEREESKL